MVMISPVDVAEISEALVQQLRSSLPSMLSEEVRVERSEVPNESPDNCPWVGVYRTRHVLPIRTLGMGSGFRQQRVTLAVVMNEASSESGAVCEDRLEKLVKATLSAILNDTSIGGTVAEIEDVDITYSNYTTSGNSFFQEAVVQMTAVTNVTAS